MGKIVGHAAELQQEHGLNGVQCLASQKVVVIFCLSSQKTLPEPPPPPPEPAPWLRDEQLPPPPQPLRSNMVKLPDRS